MWHHSAEHITQKAVPSWLVLVCEKPEPQQLSLASKMQKSLTADLETITRVPCCAIFSILSVLSSQVARGWHWQPGDIPFLLPLG